MIRVLGEDSGILHESSENFPLCHCAGVGSSSLSGTGVVFKGCQDRIRPGSRLELESSSRGVRTGYVQGQGWSWSRPRGVSGQDTARVKAGAGIVFEGCQGRMRPGSRLELESSSRGVRAGCGQGQGWSWSRLRGVSGQDAARVKAGAGIVFEGCQGRMRPGSRLELESSSML